MDVSVDLLPPTYAVKTETLSKERRRQPSNGNTSKRSKKLPASESMAPPVTLVPKHNKLPNIERRSGKDRRHQAMQRGRWLESRIRKDRRASALQVFVKV
ncbi:hypothetical protein SAMN05216262_11667 [Colwellia chukchiensis]|uniref:Uncharacterized protein n=1 Tax=Colwellia chukchiensis TaxID=641665 RepID=A0A1H7RZQ6_9GAMM|nr:hypothetical protein [Colwellia chukchiensis]SEL65529.1 hypothetical protein SAMN05216262_11667 [Colwellia chukchiensis]